MLTERFLRNLGKQIDRPGSLDLAGDLAVHLGGNASHTTGKDLACFRRKFRQEIRIQEINLIQRDIVTATRHHAVAATKTNTTFDSLRFCGHEYFFL